MTQLSEWCLSLVTLAIIVLIHCLMCKPLLGLGKHLLSKGMNTRGSASLCLLLTLLFCIYSFCFSPLMLHSLLLHIQNPHRRTGQSVTIQSKMTRGQSYHTSYHWDPPVSPVFNLQWIAFDWGVESCSNWLWLGKWLGWPRSWGISYSWVRGDYCDWLLVEFKWKNVFYFPNILFVH